MREMTPPATVSASEFRQNFGKYVKLVEKRDVQVTRNGRVSALWTNPHRDRMKIARDLAGSIHAEVDLERDREERWPVQ